MTEQTIDRIYYGIYLAHALKCLKANQPKNAVSWMERELGEIDDSLGYGTIDPVTLKITCNGWIGYQLFSETQFGFGEGI